MLQCGTQRCFFPTGLAFYTYARTCYDSSLPAKDIKDRYFSLIFGDCKNEVEEYLLKLEAAFSTEYIAGLKATNYDISRFYNPEHIAYLAKVEAIADEGKEMILRHFNSEIRPETVAMRVLLAHNVYVRYFAKAMIEKARGCDDAAKKIFEEMMAEVGKYECEIEQYYDHGLPMNALKVIFEYTTSNLPQNDYMDVD